MVNSHSVKQTACSYDLWNFKISLVIKSQYYFLIITYVLLPWWFSRHNILNKRQYELSIVYKNCKYPERYLTDGKSLSSWVGRVRISMVIFLSLEIELRNFFFQPTSKITPPPETSNHTSDNEECITYDELISMATNVFGNGQWSHSITSQAVGTFDVSSWNYDCMEATVVIVTVYLRIFQFDHQITLNTLWANIS